jgi:GGDEF domain-containing protein
MSTLKNMTIVCEHCGKKIIFDQPREIRISVSIGVAGMSQNNPDCHVLIENVDVGLYHAKQDGRNHLIIYETNMFKPTNQTG